MITLIWIACAVATAVIASAKKRDSFAWLAAGCLFGIFALIVVAAIPALPQRESNRVLFATMAILLAAGLGGTYVYGHFFAYPCLSIASEAGCR